MNELSKLEIEVMKGEELTDDELFRIQAEIEKSIPLPDAKNGPALVLLVGLIGTGKTTTAKLLEKKLGLVRVCLDDAREMLFRDGFNFDRVREIGKNLVVKYLQAGYRVIIDADSSGPTTREQVNQLEKMGMVPIFWIHITAPEEVVVERVLKNPDQLFRGEYAVEKYHKRKLLHENLDMPFIATIDTSRDDFEKQVNEAVEKIQDSL